MQSNQVKLRQFEDHLVYLPAAHQTNGWIDGNILHESGRWKNKKSKKRKISPNEMYKHTHKVHVINFKWAKSFALRTFNGCKTDLSIINLSGLWSKHIAI